MIHEPRWQKCIPFLLLFLFLSSIDLLRCLRFVIFVDQRMHYNALEIKALFGRNCLNRTLGQRAFLFDVALNTVPIVWGKERL